MNAGRDLDLGQELHRWFGLPGFRGQQEAVIRHFLGGGDALVVMPTGEGKSLCYQLPALVGEGLTLVVSPLIALMDDQVAALRRRDLPATCLHSRLDAGERARRLAALRSGALKLLYVTPERFRVPGFMAALAGVAVARLVVDEAHCVSQWGHDFRPDYVQLGDVRRALGQPPCLALTATATPDVQQDIRAVLGLAEAPLFHAGIGRDNLFLAVTACDSDEVKLERLLELLPRTGGPAIVYCALIADLLRLETGLQRRGLEPLVYHGELSAHERESQQALFQDSDCALLLATNAFGMGVDKADIRAIVHWQLPRTLEAYYQEVGRAGRDGRSSLCELLYREEDLQIQRNFVEWANPGHDLLLQVADHLERLGDRIHALDLDALRATLLHGNRHDGRIETCLRLLTSGGCLRGEIGRDLEFVRMPGSDEVRRWLPEDKRRRDLIGLHAMVRYAAGHDCRRLTIHRHFGSGDAAVPCGACDVCADQDLWLQQHLPAPRPVPARAPALPDAPVQRGEWIDVQGLGLCCIVRVHRGGGSLRADVEVAADLSERSVDLRRRRWRRV